MKVLKTFFKNSIIYVAGIIDDLMIRYYVWRDDCDTPCNRLQAWARFNRKGDGMEATLKD
jgi:hypothetical protein